MSTETDMAALYTYEARQKAKRKARALHRKAIGESERKVIVAAQKLNHWRKGKGPVHVAHQLEGALFAAVDDMERLKSKPKDNIEGELPPPAGGDGGAAVRP